MAMGFQKYLDEAFSKINIADFEESEPEEPPPRDIYGRFENSLYASAENRVSLRKNWRKDPD